MPHVKTEKVIMLQPDAMAGKRIASVEEMGRYLKGVCEVFAKVYEKIDTPETVNAVVAVKPGRRRVFGL